MRVSLGSIRASERRALGSVGPKQIESLGIILQRLEMDCLGIIYTRFRKLSFLTSSRCVPASLSRQARP